MTAVDLIEAMRQWELERQYCLMSKHEMAVDRVSLFAENSVDVDRKCEEGLLVL